MVSKNIKLSATRISTFLRCKKKYWFNYHERLPKMSNPSFKLGIAVHESLEFAGNLWIKNNLTKFSDADVKKVMKVYNETSVKEGMEDMYVHKLGAELVKARLKDFMDGKKIISLEKKFGFKDTPEIETDLGVPLMGAIDRVEEIDSETLLIVDYKTSNTLPTQDQLRSDTQLSLYDIVARKMWPDYKRYILSLDFLKHEMMFSYRTDEERAEFNEYLKVIYDSMLAFEDKDAKPEINMFCSWCDFRDSCDAYKDICSNEEYVFAPLAAYDDDALIKEWDSIKNTKKILEQRDREISMTLMEKIRDTGAPVVGDDNEVYVRQNARVTYDTQEIARVIPQDEFAKMANVNKGAVDRYIRDNPYVKDAIEKAAVTNYTNPFLAVRKAKK